MVEIKEKYKGLLRSIIKFMISNEFQMAKYTNECAARKGTKHELILRDDLWLYLKNNGFNVDKEKLLKKEDYPTLFKEEDKESWQIDLMIFVDEEAFPIEIKLCNSEEDVERCRNAYPEDVYRMQKLTQKIKNIHYATTIIFCTQTALRGNDDTTTYVDTIIPGLNTYDKDKEDLIKDLKTVWTPMIKQPYFLAVNIATK